MSEDPEKLQEGTLISHLLELRNRLMRALIAVGLVFAPCAYYSNQLFEFIALPLMKIAKVHGFKLIATGVTTTFVTPFKLSFFVALFVAIPYVLFQVWAFVAPGLYKHEKRFAIPLVVSSILLFYIGVAFAYQFVFPVMFEFFATAAPKGVEMNTDINSYLDFVLTMFLAFGVAFEVPVVVVLLVITGIVPLEKLKSSRGYVLIGIFVIAAFLTPPDAVSQCIMAVPMYLLYEGGIIMARVLSGMRRPEAEEEDAVKK